MTDEKLEGSNGPCASRQRRELKKPGLLEGLQICVSGKFTGLDKAAVEDLLRRAGARSVKDTNSFSSAGFVLVDSVSMEAEGKDDTMLEMAELLRSAQTVK